VVWRSSFGVIPFVVFLPAALPGAPAERGFFRIQAIVITTAVFVSLCFTGWQLVTQRPVLTVDASGIRMGRRRFVPWSEIGMIGDPEGPPVDRSFVVVRIGTRRRLRLGPQHVRDLPAFTHWLRAELEQHKHSETAN